MKVKVLVLPVLRRYWLFHAWKEIPAHEQVTRDWREAPSLKEKVSTLISNFQVKASKKAEEQWHKFEAAPEGSLNNRFFRFAQWALSRVDPSETFLKALPQQADSLEIMYPASLPERLVRRRLRHLAATAEPFHNSRLRVWSAALVPQLPLIPLPLPNVTIYYTLWRIVSNRSAGRGARGLSAALEWHSDQQRLKLAEQLQRLQQQGVVLKRGSWAEQLAAEAPKLQQMLEHRAQDLHQENSSGTSSEQQQLTKRLPVPHFVSDQQLEQLVSPKERQVSPLPETAVVQLAEAFHQHHLLEHYRAANRKCLGDKAQQQTLQQQQQSQEQQQPKETANGQHSSDANSLSTTLKQASSHHQQVVNPTASGPQSSTASMAAAAASHKH